MISATPGVFLSMNAMMWSMCYWFQSGWFLSGSGCCCFQCSSSCCWFGGRNARCWLGVFGQSMEDLNLGSMRSWHRTMMAAARSMAAKKGAAVVGFEVGAGVVGGSACCSF
jgi:hypothetical protein